MIFTDRTIIVQKGISSINDTIILYRGDKGVEIRFTLNEGSPFRFGSGASPNIIEKTEAAYGQLIIKRPNDLPAIFSEVAPTNEGKIVFTITAEMIDEITEVGNYTFQIRLLDESRNSRATIPEVVNGIEIREPIATEDVSNTNEVNVATVGYAMTTAGTTEDAFDTQGNYNKTTWGTGDRITDAKLNKIEAGIDGVNQKVASGGTGSNNAGDISIADTGNYFTSTNIEGALQEAGSQIKEIPNRTIVEDGKLYLVKSDGTKIDSGTTLPTVGNSNNNNTDSGTYDTEISLPYTANSDTDVELTFSPNNSVSYTNLCPTGDDISQYTIQNNGAAVVTNEIIDDPEKGSCLHYKNAGTGGYSQLKLFSSNSWDSTRYYYVSYWVKMVIKSTNYTGYPEFNCGSSAFGNTNSFNYDLTSWQRVSFITQPASYLTTGIGFNILADGEFYFKPIIVLDMEGLGYDLSSINANAKTYIADLDPKVLQTSNEFSCIVNNGSNVENIEAFTTGDKVYYYTVTKGNTLSIGKRDGYAMPTVAAKVKSNGDIIQNVEDVDIKITTRFAGKKVVFEGDSITDSDYHEAYNGKSWADYLANKLKMTIASNMALGGSSISTYNSAGSVVNRITSNTYPSDTKLFCIMAGTNDWNSNVALGNIDSTDTSTILGALNTIIDHLQTNYPDATIVIMTPMHRSGMRTATRTAGTLSDVAEAYEKVCMNWGVNCINTLKEFGMNAYNTTVANKFYVEQDSDWLHPNPAGHKKIATRMAGYISTL